MADIFLVRHGEAAAGWGEDPDPGLSRLGHQQARQARDELELVPGLGIISSPLVRARQTAQPLAATLQTPMAIDEAFREIPSPVGIEERSAWLKGFMHQEWSEQSPELLAWRDEAWNRLFEFEGNTAIFTHFMVINAILGKLTQAEETVCCLPDYGAIMKLHLEGDSLELESIGRQMQTRVN